MACCSGTSNSTTLTGPSGEIGGTPAATPKGRICLKCISTWVIVAVILVVILCYGRKRGK